MNVVCIFPITWVFIEVLIILELNTEDLSATKTMHCDTLIKLLWQEQK